MRAVRRYGQPHCNGSYPKEKGAVDSHFLASAARVQVLGSGSSRLFPCQLNQFLKGWLVANGHIGQNLPVQLDTRQPHSIHELAVRGSGGAASSPYPYNPQPAEIAFLFPAVAVGVRPSMNQSFFSPLVIAVRTTLEASGSQ